MRNTPCHPCFKRRDLPALVVGLVWIAGGIFNLAVTARMADPFGWIAIMSPVRPYRWFFGKVVCAHPVHWARLLAVGELALGTLTITPGKRRSLGLAGGTLFSGFLASLATPYTWVMAPYAALLTWLTRREARIHGAAERLRRTEA